ncbi:MAG: nucleotide exchange factor GrpE [Candidatus Izemoplasmatales bacterium]|jgi:molecular chaperone GrpE|nr:nucleotide exchange factor GrpE [Candidatus Izemoplasmatales bacterium]MDD3865797.1 nucleotide exchange factor GrpE [Candidatus Izemoplasmatales bacterium]
MTKDKDEKMKPDAKQQTPEPATKIPTLDEQIETLSQELADIKDKYLRALAEMENFKKRNSDELHREKRYASMPVCDKLIDQLEIFDQALNVQTEDSNFKNFLYGFKMIKDMIYAVLVEEGVSQIDIQIGDGFDPTISHAVDKTQDADKNDNVVVKIVKKGYKYKDRLLRPAMVVINLKPIESEAETATDNTKFDSNIA